jgi:DNA-binding NtrC family response regulator
VVRSLATANYEVLEADSAQSALALLSTTSVNVIVTDLRMPGMDGISLLKRAKVIAPQTGLILMTAFASVETAVEAMKAGASDYLTKPLNLEEMIMRVERLLREQKLAEENLRLRGEVSGRYDLRRNSPIIYSSEVMKDVLKTASLVSMNRSNVLIHGDTGTGKELVARCIHFSGPRANAPFVAINCGSMSKSLLESQLFGHIKGAFTGAIADNPGFFLAADGGTLFLDEITEIDEEMQVRLLRAVQEREVIPVGGTKPVSTDVRIVAATNRNAQDAMQDGSFRRDLFYRLSVVSIRIPPLHERADDIKLLAEYFSSRLSREYGLAPRSFTPEALGVLESHGWPGNVRELENVVERAFALGCGPTIGIEDLPPELTSGSRDLGRDRSNIRHAQPSLAATQPVAETATPERPSLEEAERMTIIRALEESENNRSAAARLLGVDRKRLYRLLHKHGLI